MTHPLTPTAQFTPLSPSLEFRARFVAAAAQMKLGDPLRDETEIGPMISDEASQRVADWVAEAVQEGAELLSGGLPDGRMFPPTILTNVTERMKVMCAEAFGPLVSLIPFSDYEAALEALDTSEFGLQAGIFTPSLAHALLAVQRLNVGGVIINDTPTFRVDNMPYGGNKNSGVGREGPRFAIEEMTTLKMVVMQP